MTYDGDDANEFSLILAYLEPPLPSSIPSFFVLLQKEMGFSFALSVSRASESFPSSSMNPRMYKIYLYSSLCEPKFLFCTCHTREMSEVY